MKTEIMRTLSAATILALLLGACSSKSATTGAGADADAGTDALSCGAKDAHFAELDDHCAAVVGCAIFKAAIPKCEPGAVKACTCGECYGKQCVAALCWPCADAAVGDTDAAAEDVSTSEGVAPCSWQVDNACPTLCSLGNDIDCCLQMGGNPAPSPLCAIP